jgi:hypothetical protein
MQNVAIRIDKKHQIYFITTVKCPNKKEFKTHCVTSRFDDTYVVTLIPSVSLGEAAYFFTGKFHNNFSLAISDQWLSNAET